MVILEVAPKASIPFAIKSGDKTAEMINIAKQNKENSLKDLHCF